MGGSRRKGARETLSRWESPPLHLECLLQGGPGSLGESETCRWPPRTAPQEPPKEKAKMHPDPEPSPLTRGSPIHGRPLGSSPSPGPRTPAHTRILCPQSRATAWSVAPAKSAACWGAAHAASARPTARGSRRVCRSAARTAPPTETSANCAPRAAADTQTCASCIGAAAAVRGAGPRGSANQGSEGGSRWAEPSWDSESDSGGGVMQNQRSWNRDNLSGDKRGGAWRIRSANQNLGAGTVEGGDCVGGVRGEV